MTIKNFLKKYLVLIIVLILIPAIAFSTFAIGEYWLHKIYMNAGEWAAFVGAVLSYMGTVLLGVLAFWQNERLKIDNEKSQSELKKQNDYLLDINKRLLTIEENRGKSFLFVQPGQTIIKNATSQMITMNETIFFDYSKSNHNSKMFQIKVLNPTDNVILRLELNDLLIAKCYVDDINNFNLIYRIFPSRIVPVPYIQKNQEVSLWIRFDDEDGAINKMKRGERLVFYLDFSTLSNSMFNNHQEIILGVTAIDPINDIYVVIQQFDINKEAIYNDNDPS